jgi:DNA-binding beta-propeller fold protein YncE
MASTDGARGLIAVDKMGTKVLFLDPVTYETQVVLDGFEKTVHELLVVPETGLAYVPIFGDGIHGRNPNPQHVVCVFDLNKRAHVGTIDLRPYIAPHTLKLGPDGLIYITCENSAVVAVIDRATNTVVDAIDSGSTNGHRLIISPDGQRLYTENAEPALILIDTASERVSGEVRLDGVAKPAQIARYAPDDRVLCVTSVHSGTVTLIDPSFRTQTAIKVGSQAMDMAFRGDELFVACQGDGSVHIIDIPARRWKSSFQAGTGCESLGFF